jgi:hypothetical protein
MIGLSANLCRSTFSVLHGNAESASMRVYQRSFGRFFRLGVNELKLRLFGETQGLWVTANNATRTPESGEDR